jgi:hypothetical protein
MRWAPLLLLWLLLAISANAQNEPDQPLEGAGPTAPSKPGQRTIGIAQSSYRNRSAR